MCNCFITQNGLFYFQTTDLGITEQIGDSPTKFEIWFRKRKLNDTFLLQAPNPEVKAAWVSDLRKILVKQAFKNRGMVLFMYDFFLVFYIAYFQKKVLRIAKPFIKIFRLRQKSVAVSGNSMKPEIKHQIFYVLTYQGGGEWTFFFSLCQVRVGYNLTCTELYREVYCNMFSQEYRINSIYNLFTEMHKSIPLCYDLYVKVVCGQT